MGFHLELASAVHPRKTHDSIVEAFSLPASMKFLFSVRRTKMKVMGTTVTMKKQSLKKMMTTMNTENLYPQQKPVQQVLGS